MKAMILAAGRGERMRPLTDHTPKPLLEAGGKPLIVHLIERLRDGGFDDLVVNHAHLGEQIEAALGNGERWRVRIRYSAEGEALETAGGIARALPLLADVFWIVAGDVHAPQFLFTRAAYDSFAAGGRQAHLFLVPNPPHNPQGDFGLAPDGSALNRADVRYTYSTIALVRHSFFAGLPHGNPQGQKVALAPLLRAAMDRGEVSAELYHGPWTDVGTPERLAALNAAPQTRTMQA